MTGREKLDPDAIGPCFHCLFPMYGPLLRVERVPVPVVRTPVTRGTGACSRGTDPRYAWNGCLFPRYGPPLRMERVPVRDVSPPVSHVRATVRHEKPPWRWERQAIPECSGNECKAWLPGMTVADVRRAA